jgi:hypothetical protein
MNRVRLASVALLAGLALSAGCANMGNNNCCNNGSSGLFGNLFHRNGSSSCCPCPCPCPAPCETGCCSGYPMAPAPGVPMSGPGLMLPTQPGPMLPGGEPPQLMQPRIEPQQAVPMQAAPTVKTR